MSTSYLTEFETPQTLLQGVNLVLESIGQSQVASLDATDTNPSALSALTYIGDAMRETFAEGWTFNTLYEHRIDPDGSGHINLPANTMRIKEMYTPGLWDKKLVQRGQKLFDAKGATYVIGKPVILTVVVGVDYEDTPQDFRRYVAIVACRRAASLRAGSTTAYQFSKADEGIARLRLEQSEADWDKNTMYSNPHIRRWNRR